MGDMVSEAQRIVEQAWGLPDVEVARRWHDGEKLAWYRTNAVQLGLIHACAAIRDRRLRVLRKLLDAKAYGGLHTRRHQAGGPALFYKYVFLTGYADEVLGASGAIHMISVIAHAAEKNDLLDDVGLREVHTRIWALGPTAAAAIEVPESVTDEPTFAPVAVAVMCKRAMEADSSEQQQAWCVRLTLDLIARAPEPGEALMCCANLMCIDMNRAMGAPPIPEPMPPNLQAQLGIVGILLEAECVADVSLLHWQFFFGTLMERGDPMQLLVAAASRHAKVGLNFVTTPILKPFAMARFRRIVRALGRVRLVARRYREDFYHPANSSGFVAVTKPSYAAIMAKYSEQ